MRRKADEEYLTLAVVLLMLGGVLALGWAEAGYELWYAVLDEAPGRLVPAGFCFLVAYLVHGALSPQAVPPSGSPKENQKPAESPGGALVRHGYGAGIEDICHRAALALGPPDS